MKPALVVASGHQGLGVTRALAARGIEVVVASAADHDLASASRHATEALRVPRPERDGPAFVEALLELAERFPGAVLMATSDDGVRDVARHRDRLAEVFRVACPPWEAVRRCVDKGFTYELAASLGIPMPLTETVATVEQALAAAARVGYPCVVKPRESHLYAERFDAKAQVVGDAGALSAGCEDALAAGLGVMIQELIPGRDALGVNYNAFRAHGAVVADCTARKLRLAPPRFGIPRVVVSEEIADLAEPARAILDALGLEGFANVEFKLDERDGTYKFLEVNCRHNRSTLLSVCSGLDFPYMDYRYALDGTLPSRPRQRTGIYWIEETGDVMQSLTRAGRDGASVRELAAPWRAREKVFATFDRRDLGPWATNVRRLAAEGGRAIVRAVLERAAPRWVARRRAALGED